MLHLLHRPPVIRRRVLDGPQLRLCVTVGHDVEPVAVAAVLGDAVFVWRQEDRAIVRADDAAIEQVGYPYPD